MIGDDDQVRGPRGGHSRGLPSATRHGTRYRTPTPQGPPGRLGSPPIGVPGSRHGGNASSSAAACQRSLRQVSPWPRWRSYASLAAEHKRQGRCDLTIGEICIRAKYCRTVVQNCLYWAERRGTGVIVHHKAGQEIEMRPCPATARLRAVLPSPTMRTLPLIWLTG